MPAAAPTINATAGSNPPNGTAIVVGSTVQLGNVDAGGEVTYLWEILDKPEGSSSALSNPNIVNPTFVADSEGTYLLKLTVNRLLANPVSARVIVGVAQLKTGMRIPAAGESTEASTLRGWAEAVNRDLKLLDNLRADPGYMMGVAGGSLSVGKLLRVVDMSTLKSGLPGQELVPKFSAAKANDAGQMDLPLWVFVSKVGGGTSASLGDKIYARITGIVGPVSLPGGAVGDPVFVDDTGALSNAAGTYTRRVGTIVYISGSNYYVHFNGSLGHHEGFLYTTPGSSATYSGVIARTGAAVLATEDSSVGGEVWLQNANGHTWAVSATGRLYPIHGSGVISGLATPASGDHAANKDYVDTVAAALATPKSVLSFGNTATPSSGAECALDPGFGIRDCPVIAGNTPLLNIPFAGTIRNLRVRAAVGPGGAALDFTVYKYVSGSPSVSSITCQLAIAGTSASDLTHTLTVAAGDQIQVRVKSAGSVTSGAQEVTASLQITPT